MSYLVQNSSHSHSSMLSSCLSRWAVCEGDMYMVSSEGHRVYTSHRLLAFSSPNFLAHILPSSTETALSLPFSSSSLSLLCNLLSKGLVYSEIAVDKAEVEEAALCLRIHLQLQESSTEFVTREAPIIESFPDWMGIDSSLISTWYSLVPCEYLIYSMTEREL